MNQYLSYIIKKADTDHEFRDAATIGGIGMGTHVLATHITNASGINGAVAKGIKNATPMAERIGGALKTPLKSLGSLAKSQGLRKNLKIGAIGGAVGLLGDYAAVKLNKHMNKEASENKYLEKIKGIK
jgi:hypothetical protein